MYDLVSLQIEMILSDHCIIEDLERSYQYDPHSFVEALWFQGCYEEW